MYLYFASSLLVLIGGFGNVALSQTMPANSTFTLSNLILDFALKLQLESTSLNSVQSPISITILLGQLLLGTNGSTKEELKVGLQLSNNFKTEDFHLTFKEMLRELDTANQGVILNIANRLYVQSEKLIYKNFLQLSEKYYGTQLHAENFHSDPNGAMLRINEWVRDRTKGKIDNLLEQPYSSQTELVSVNTVYFNGAWDVPFIKDFTTNYVFSTGTKNITVPMMVNILPVKQAYNAHLNADMFALPYTGKRIAMYFMIPRGQPSLRTLRNLEFKLTAPILNSFIGSMQEDPASIRIPRMRLTYKSNLKDVLRKLQINSIFDPTLADFSSLSPSNNIYLTDIVHAVTMEITETGTEAAAATAASHDRFGGYNTYILNKPSIIMIIDLKTGATLFYGRVTEPESIILKGN